ncbi:MAG: amidohydrolase [Flavobacteriales bacterium]|nr:amidohydrolase [Flavobacteriales bacterium]
MRRFYFIIIITTIYMTSCSNKNKKAELIVHNARIYTVNESFTIAEAMVIDNGKIIAIGPENEIKNRHSAHQYLDAQKRAIFPGFIDAHCHFYGYANTLQELDLVGVKSFDELLHKAKEFQKNNKFEWLLGFGWDQNLWADKHFPNKNILDSLFPTIPVYLTRIDGHAALVNQKALDLAKVDKNTSIDGGFIETQNGKLTGIVLDNAMDIFKQIIPNKTKEQIILSLIEAEKNLLANGITTIDEAGINKIQIELLEELHNTKKLKIKVYAMISAEEDLLDYYLKKGPFKTERLHVNSFKFYSDGALGSRGACLLQPYSDITDKEEYGLIIHPKDYYEKYAALIFEKGFQMNTHCIGDSANRMILNIYKNTLKKSNDRRWRIEHAQIVDQQDIETFGAYNIIPSVQPTHATSDMDWALQRLGNERITNAYAYKNLMKQNGMIALGTDFPIENINPFYTFYAAVVRKNLKGEPNKGFQTENKLSKEEALRGMTIWAAISNFEENEKGSLEVGKTADFVILNQDIMNINESLIPKTKVLYTFINGEKVFESKQ